MGALLAAADPAASPFLAGCGLAAGLLLARGWLGVPAALLIGGLIGLTEPMGPRTDMVGPGIDAVMAAGLWYAAGALVRRTLRKLAQPRAA